jgi:hypothetical protein
MVLVVLLIGALFAGYVVKAHRATAEEQPVAAAEPPAPMPEAPPAQAAQSVSATITAIVPAETFVHLDSHGRPVEAMTNTGTRPAPTDHFFVEQDGAVHAADSATVAQVLDWPDGVDWTQPGRWHTRRG